MSLNKIAKAAGVSPATVSRVINKRRGISAKTTKKVLEVMKQLDYTPLPKANRPGPNYASKSIKNGNCGMVLLGIESTILHGPYARVVHQVEAALSDYGMNMLLGCATSAEKSPAFLNNGKVDCVIFLGHLFSKEWFERVVGDIPCLWVMGDGEPFGDHIFPDNELVGQLAAKYLISKGCNNTMGLVYHRTRKKDFWSMRKVGFADIMEQNQKQFTILDAFELGVADTGALTEIFVEKVMAMPEKPDGIFVAGDTEVPMVYREIRKIGLEPGKDVFIVSVNNEESYLAMFEPRPASVDLCPEVIGQMAVEQILWRIAHPEFETRISCKVEPMLVTPEGDIIRSGDIQ